MNVELRFSEFKNDWDNRSLNNLGAFVSDGIHSTPVYDENGSYYFINGNNLINGKITVSETTKRVDESEYQKHKKALTNNTILMSINGTIGNLAFYDSEKVVLGKSACYIVLDESQTDKLFVYYLLQTPAVIRKFNSELTGTTIKNLSLATVKKTKFGFPTLKEQRKIAGFLGAVDAKLDALRRKRWLVAEYKRGVMQKLFTQEIRFVGDGERPFVEWEEHKLKELGQFIGGGTPSTNEESYWQGNIPWISSSDISEDSINDVTISRYITIRAISESATKLVPAHSILLVSRVGVGKLAVSNVELCTSQDFTNFIPYRDNVYFLAYLLHFHKNKLLAFSQGTSIKGFTIADIGLLKIELPHIEEQCKIADFLAAIDNKITAVDQQIDQMQTFKKGLLQQLFV